MEFIQKSWNTDTERFPGPQPVSIERRHFPLLKKQPYYVCEKTDGVRYFLISIEDGVSLVNRAFVTTPVKMRLPKQTLLDGELVQCKNGSWLFSVYDATIIRGEDVMGYPLNKRLEKITALVKTIIRTTSAPFEIRVKTMYPLERISDLPSTFDYETDGLVFTPVNEPVRSGTHETMFKFKPTERITIDFQLKNKRGLYVAERCGLVLKSRLQEPFDHPDGTIVECGFHEGMWRVEKIRTDKTYPNNSRTYARTCINIQEDIQIQEFHVV